MNPADEPIPPAGDDWQEFVIRDDLSVRFPKGSLAARDFERAELKRRDQMERGRMNWSLGEFSDLLWMHVPEARPVLLEIIRHEIEDAIEYNDFLDPLRDSKVADAVYFELLAPSLREPPGNRGVAKRVLAVMRHLIAQGGTGYRDIFGPEVFEIASAQKLMDALKEVDPKIIPLSIETWGGSNT